MRQVAAYALKADCTTAGESKILYQKVNQSVRTWLIRKGADPNSLVDDEFFVSLKDGREALCSRETISAKGCEINLYRLVEPMRQGGEFCTTIGAGLTESATEVYCAQEVGHEQTVFSPITYEARCPIVLREVLAFSCTWRVGESALEVSARRMSGLVGGRSLADIIRDPKRSLPIVVVSEDHGFPLHPNMDALLSDELPALANVYSIDDEASWELTRVLGQSWSCFGAAIRLYWPHAAAESNPFAHPLWTAPKLMFSAGSTEEAARRLTDQLRRQLMSVASFSVREPASFGNIRSQARRDANALRLAEAKSIDEIRGLAEEYATYSLELEAKIKQVTEERDRALTDLANEKLLRSFEQSTGDIEPETETPPATVAEAFARARQTLGDFLIFGDDCERGVEGLSENAGPPDKILLWLQVLAEATRLRRNGTLGMSVIPWLRSRGLRVSGEGQVIANNSDECSRRTWHDGEGDRYFDMHLKPVEAASPDRCVRIYFEWNEAKSRYAVGWIGRHP